MTLRVSRFIFRLRALFANDFSPTRQCYKTFYAHNIPILPISYSVSPEQAFLVEQLEGAALGKAPALSSNIIIGRKILPWTNNLAYYEKFGNYGHKCFITLGPDWNSVVLVYTHRGVHGCDRCLR